MYICIRSCSMRTSLTVSGCVMRCASVCAQSFDESSPQLARQLGTASMTLSMAGIAVSLLTVVLVVSTGGFHVHPDNITAAGNITLDDVRDGVTLHSASDYRTNGLYIGPLTLTRVRYPRQERRHGVCPPHFCQRSFRRLMQIR